MKEQAIKDYINKYPQLYSWLYFNVVLESPGNTSLLTDSDNILAEYIDGSKEREYLFSVAMVKNYDAGTSDINMLAMQETQNFIAWVQNNNSEKILPDFGEKCMVDDVEVITEVPTLAVDTEKNMARYLISMRVPYTERR